MLPETEIALRNYDSLVRSTGLDDVSLDWDSKTLVYGDGGTDIDILTQRGFTDGTRD